MKRELKRCSAFKNLIVFVGWQRIKEKDLKGTIMTKWQTPLTGWPSSHSSTFLTTIHYRCGSKVLALLALLEARGGCITQFCSRRCKVCWKLGGKFPFPYKRDNCERRTNWHFPFLSVLPWMRMWWLEWGSYLMTMKQQTCGQKPICRAKHERSISHGWHSCPTKPIPAIACLQTSSNIYYGIF